MEIHRPVEPPTKKTKLMPAAEEEEDDDPMKIIDNRYKSFDRGTPHGGRSGKGGCYTCGRQGHLFRDCPKGWRRGQEKGISRGVLSKGGIAEGVVARGALVDGAAEGIIFR